MGIRDVDGWPRVTSNFPRPHHGMHSTELRVLPSGQKVKMCVPRMRACDERNQKDKLCAGHIKRWYGAGPDLTNEFGSEIYRCERCQTLYLPNPTEAARTRGLWW
jgi:hypothetical protein